MSFAVALESLGLVSRLGDRLEDVLATPADAMSAGPADLDPATRFGDRNYRPLDRTGQLTVAAVGDCLAAFTDLPARDRSGLVVGTAFGSVATISSFDRRAQTAGPLYAKPLDFANSVINAAAGQAAIWHDLQGVNATCCGGTTSGLLALLYGSDVLRARRADLVVAGGVEEHCEELLRATESGGWLPADRLGEASAFFGLRPDHEGARVRMLGGAARSAPGAGEEVGRLGPALRDAIEAALGEAGVDASRIRVASPGTASGAETDEVESGALESWSRGLPRFEVKRRTGECLGASGALQLLPFWGWSRELPVAEWPAEGESLCGLVTSVDRQGLAAAAVIEARRGR